MFDVHFHWIPEGFMARAREAFPQDLMLAKAPFENTDAALRNKEENGIETSVISFGDQLESLIRSYPGTRADACRALNEEAAELRLKYPGKFLHYAAVDMLAGEEAVPGFEQAVREYGCAGLEMLHSYAKDGEAIFPHDRRFWPLYKKAEELGVPVFVHPTIPSYWKDLPEAIQFTAREWGFLLGDQLAIHLLACGGVFDAFPRLPFIFCQLGGFMPVSLGRSDLGMLQHADFKSRQMSSPDMKLVRLRDYVGRFYVDTHSADAPSIRCAAENLGVDRVLLATDYPITRPQMGTPWHIAQARNTGLGEEAFRAITSVNGKRLFNLA